MRQFGRRCVRAATFARDCRKTGGLPDTTSAGLIVTSAITRLRRCDGDAGTSALAMCVDDD